MNILSLFFIEFKLRYITQYSSILNRFSVTKNISNVRWILINILIKVLTGVVFYFSIGFAVNNHSHEFLYSLAIFLMVSTLLKAISSYKEAAVLKSSIYVYSPLSTRNVYNINMISMMIWSLFGNISILSMFIITSFKIFGAFFGVLVSFNLILLLTAIFMAVNKVTTLYFVNKINKPIGIVRLMFYITFSIVYFTIGYKLVDILKHPFYIIRSQIATTKTFIDDVYAKKVTMDLLDSFINPLFGAINKFFSLIDQLGIFSLSSLYLTFLLLAVNLCALIVKGTTSVDRLSFSIETKYDFLHYASLFYEYINRKFFKNELLSFEIKLLERERFLVSPNFFQLTIFTYESIFFMGLFFNIFITSTSGNLSYLLFTALLLLILFNHCFELRTENPQLFLLGANKEKVLLFRYSGIGTYAIYKSKILLMYCLLIIPAFLLLLINIILISYNVVYIFGLFLLAITFVMVPIVQMWASSFLIKTDYASYVDIGNTEEEEIIEKIQAIPRRILVLPLLYLLYGMLFIRIPEDILGFLFYLYLAFYLLGTTSYLLFFAKHAKENIKKFDSKNIRM